MKKICGPKVFEVERAVSLSKEDVGPQTAALSAPPSTFTDVLARNAADGQSAAALLSTAVHQINMSESRFHVDLKDTQAFKRKISFFVTGGNKLN